MRHVRLKAIAAVAAVAAVVVVLAGQGYAADTELEVVEGGAHCQEGPRGPHWAWDLRVFPGAEVESSTIEQPWTIERVEGPNEQGRLILHAVSTSPIEDRPYTVTVNDDEFRLTPTVHNPDSSACPGATPPPQPPEQPKPPEVEGGGEQVVTPPVVESVHEVAAPASTAPAVAPTTVLAAQATNSAALPRTGAGDAVLAAIAAALIACGLLGIRFGCRGARGMREAGPETLRPPGGSEVGPVVGSVRPASWPRFASRYRRARSARATVRAREIQPSRRRKLPCALVEAHAVARPSRARGTGRGATGARSSRPPERTSTGTPPCSGTSRAGLRLRQRGSPDPLADSRALFKIRSACGPKQNVGCAPLRGIGQEAVDDKLAQGFRRSPAHAKTLRDVVSVDERFRDAHCSEACRVGHSPVPSDRFGTSVLDGAPEESATRGNHLQHVPRRRRHDGKIERKVRGGGASGDLSRVRDQIVRDMSRGFPTAPFE